MRLQEDPSYQALAWKFPALAERLESQLVGGGRIEFTAGQLAAGTRETVENATEFLSKLTTGGWLQEEVRWVCPIHREPLTEEEAASGVCPYHPEDAFDPEKARHVVFWREQPRDRDVQWVLALHGMNTRGAWQEAFNWLVSRSYGRMIPVAIYKYGIVRPGVLLPCRQKHLVRRLLERVYVLTREASGGGFGPRPDVIAHSFGTWLLGHALLENPDFKVGRIILTGSILRPDFSWQSLIGRGQVEAVLNHFGTRDFWARIAHYVIPDSGPSGRKGFDDPAVINVPVEGFSHSQFFEEQEMPQLFQLEEPKGTWHDFLTTGNLSALARVKGPGWTQAALPWRATLPRFLVLFVAAAFIVLLGTAVGLGFVDLWRLAFGQRAL